MKEMLYQRIEEISGEMAEMADRIFDSPELGLHEFQACKWLTDWLEQDGLPWRKGLQESRRRSAQSTIMERAASISGCCASMTLFRGWDMPAAIICRDRPSWLLRQPCGTGVGRKPTP